MLAFTPSGYFWNWHAGCELRDIYWLGRVKFMCLSYYWKPVDFGFRACEFHSDYRMEDIIQEGICLLFGKTLNMSRSSEKYLNIFN